MDPGAHPNRRPDRRAHARRHRHRLALTVTPAWRALLALGATASAIAAAGVPPAASGYVWQLPRGFPTPAVPSDNPMSAAKVALGRRLFFETRLAVTGRYSCASCHEPARAFSDGRPLARGATGEALTHNALTLVNVAYNLSFGWNTPAVHSLEAQMRTPLLNRHPIELGVAGRERTLCAELAADPAYAREFAAAFPAQAAGGAGTAVSFVHLVQAIAAFERTLISADSPFDRYVFAGEHDALSPEAKRGMALFFSARIGCAGCHSGFNFAGNWRDAEGATGPPSFARDGTSAQPLRVPTLRNLILTAPYMHDGRFATLAEVLEHYSRLGERRAAGQRPPDRRLPRSALSARERAELSAFLASLTDQSLVRKFSAASGER
jgi:cytochrome c peroxidase